MSYFETYQFALFHLQSDYVRKISMKLLTMESRSANLVPNSLQCNSVSSSVNPSNPGTSVSYNIRAHGYVSIYIYMYVY